MFRVRHRITQPLKWGVAAGMATASAAVYWDIAFRAFNIFDSLIPNIVGGFAVGFLLPLAVSLPEFIRGKNAWILLLSTISGIAAAALAYWNADISPLQVFDGRRGSIIFRFLFGFAIPLLFFLPRLVAGVVSFFKGRQLASNRDLREISLCEQEARDTLRELMRSSVPQSASNIPARLRGLKKAREKVSSDFANDPIALADALERMDVEIADLEQQSKPSEQADVIDLPFLDAAISRCPKNASLYIERGRSYLSNGKNHHQAVSDFKQAIVLLPRYARAYDALGVAYVDQKQYAKAAEQFRKALRLDSDFYDAEEHLKALRQLRRSSFFRCIGQRVKTVFGK